jgi:HAD superfamily hydrolase (TIGR01509 family)
MKPPVKAVIFDLDGTLVDTETLSDKAVIYAFEHVLSDETLHTLRTKGLPWALKRQLLGLRGSEWAPLAIQYAIDHWRLAPENATTVMEVWNRWEQHLNALCSTVQACPGAVALVQSLQDACLPMAIATSSRAAAVEQKRKNHQDTIFSKIKVIVAGDDPAVVNGKPAPDIYLEAARQLGVDPSKCLVFEDALSGAQSGKAAGCQVVVVPDARYTAEEKVVFASVADIVLDSLLDFDGAMFGLDVKMESSKVPAKRCRESSN